MYGVRCSVVHVENGFHELFQKLPYSNTIALEGVKKFCCIGSVLTHHKDCNSHSIILTIKDSSLSRCHSHHKEASSKFHQNWILKIYKKNVHRGWWKPMLENIQTRKQAVWLSSARVKCMTFWCKPYLFKCIYPTTDNTLSCFE